MGTQIQSETYFSRHCSRNVSPNISTGRWFSYQDGKVPKNIQLADSSSPWQGLMYKYSGTSQAKARDTLLDHEVTFRHQVRELHRLYRRQRELMNEIQDNRLYKLQNKTESSQIKGSPSYAASETENAKRTRDGSHFLSSDFKLGRLHISSSRAGQSPSTVLKRKSCESFNPCNDMYLRKPVELGISESAPMNKEETVVEGQSFGLVSNGVGCTKKEPLQERASNSFFNNAVKYHISASDSESNVQSKERNFLGNYSEPFQFLSSSFSGKSSCHLSCRADELDKRSLADNVSLGFFLSKEKYQNSTPAINGRIFLDRSPPSFDGDGKELKSHLFKVNTDLSLHVDQKAGSPKKRKIFGVEIAEQVDESSLLSSDANKSYRKSDAVESDTSPFLSRGAFAGSLSKKACSQPGIHGMTTPELSWLKLDSCFQNLDLVEGMYARDALKTAVPKTKLFHQSSLCVHPQLNPELIDGGAASLDNLKGNNAFTSLPELFEFQDSSNCWKSPNSTELKAREVLKLDSEITNTSESVSQHLFKVTERTDIPSKKPNVEISTKDAEDKKDDHVIEKRVGFPSTEGISKADGMDLLAYAVSNESSIQLSANLSASDKSLGNIISGLRNHIDLNLSIDEAEAPAPAILPSAAVKIVRPEMDSEVPALVESVVEHGGTKSRAKSEDHQYQIEEAAEALVVISSALINYNASYTTSHLENTSNGLHLLADVISSYTSDEDGLIREISQTLEVCDEEGVPEGMDYFEFVTLQLKDAKEETYCYSLSDTEQRKDGEMEICATRRRGRGYKRRGRKPKDFQKDVLPDLVALAKKEVVEDFHTIEKLFHSTGKTWKSSLSRRINAKKRRQGMKSEEFLHTQEANPVRLPSKQKQTDRELQLTGKSLTGWGRRTRRLSRQRHIPVKCNG